MIVVFDNTAPKTWWPSSTPSNDPIVHFTDASAIDQSAVLVLTDRFIGHVVQLRSNGFKGCIVAFIFEPQSVYPDAYEHARANAHQFQHIITHDVEFLETLEPRIGKSYLYGETTLTANERSVMPEKTKHISLVASDKRWIEGHKMRHEIVRRLGSKIDAMGRGYKTLVSKAVAHIPYRYSIVVENSRYPRYFTEKLVDCMLGGCVPIYCGATDISNVFNMDGILTFNTIEELENIVDNIASNEDFAARAEAIRDNFERALKFADLQTRLFTMIDEFVKIKQEVNEV